MPGYSSAAAVADRSAGNGRAVERTFAILELLDSSRRGWNISEISRKLSIPKSTAHVLMRTLERMGYLRREPNSREYTLGLKIYGLGRGAAHHRYARRG